MVRGEWAADPNRQNAAARQDRRQWERRGERWARACGLGVAVCATGRWTTGGCASGCPSIDCRARTHLQQVLQPRKLVRVLLYGRNVARHGGGRELLRRARPSSAREWMGPKKHTHTTDLKMLERPTYPHLRRSIHDARTARDNHGGPLPVSCVQHPEPRGEAHTRPHAPRVRIQIPRSRARRAV